MFVHFSSCSVNLVRVFYKIKYCLNFYNLLWPVWLSTSSNLVIWPSEYQFTWAALPVLLTHGYPPKAGSTGSTFSNSSCLDSSPSSTDGSVYGGVVLRRTGTQHSLHSSPTLPSPARCSDTISDFQSSVLDSVFSSTLPRNSGASGLRSSSQVSETSGDGTLQRGCDSGSLGELRISLPPAKPARLVLRVP